MAHGGDVVATDLSQRTIENPLDWKVALALCYLALPNFLFLAGWFNIVPGVGTCLLLAFLLISTLRRVNLAGSGIRVPIQGYLLAVSAAWAFFGGGSHFVYANPDWYIRDAVVGDLVRFDWPVIYTLPSENTTWVLRSALGYFLPPAIMGKALGVELVPVSIFAWTMIGAYIFFNLLPLPEKHGPRLTFALLLVVFFSGADFVGQFIATESLPQFPERLEWWGPFSYPSLTGQLLWAPNHCLPLWLGTALLVRHAQSQDFLLLAIVVVTLSLIWTPFAVLGLIPISIFVLSRRILTRQAIIIPWRQAGVAGILAAPLLLFLTTDISGIATANALASVAPAHSVSPAQVKHQFSLQSYLLFVCCEFALLGLALLGNRRRDKGLFLFGLIVLFMLPLFRFGPSNDLILRASTPFLIVLLFECLHTLFGTDPPQSRLLAVIAGGILLIGAQTAVSELWRSATRPASPPDYKTSLLAKQDGIPAAHYMGRYRDSPVLAWLIPSPKK